MRNKKKKIYWLVTTVMIALSILYCAGTISLADDLTRVDPSIVNDPDGSGTSTLQTLGNAVLGIIQFVGVGVSIVATLVLAIKYMYSAPDDKAEVKKKLIPFIIGGFLVFGAAGLVQIAESFVNDMAG